MLVAAALRPAVSSVGPVLDEVRDGLDLSGSAVAVFTAAPVVCFGVAAAAAPALARRWGLERVLAGCVAVITAGLLLRTGPSIVTLLAGTVTAGGAIGVANVLLPALVKQDFAHRTGVMTGLYTMALTGSAALGAGATVPLAAALSGGWRVGLGFWAVPAALALLVWAPQLRGQRTTPRSTAAPGAVAALLRDRRAWAVALYFGLQSLDFYATLAWLPSVYRSAGYDAPGAGLLLSVVTVVGVPAALVLPALAARSPGQGVWVAAATGLQAAGLLGILLSPTAPALLWAVLLGVGQGASFPLALTLVALRSRDAAATARLSALAQTVGYLIAATGPFAVGALHEATGSWTPALVLLLALLVPQLGVGLAAARPGHVKT